MTDFYTNLQRAACIEAHCIPVLPWDDGVNQLVNISGDHLQVFHGYTRSVSGCASLTSVCGRG